MILLPFFNFEYVTWPVPVILYVPDLLTMIISKRLPFQVLEFVVLTVSVFAVAY